MDVKTLIKESLIEDIGRGDVTSLSTIPKDQTGTANIICKEDCVLCGINVVKNVFKIVDKKIIFKSWYKDGKKIKKGTIIAILKGNLRSLLITERTALNFLQRMSGISTTTATFVRLAKPAKVLDTRKTTPLHRELEKYAVRTGGANNHRFGLFDMILIKDNHIKAAGSITKAVKSAKTKYPNLKIEVETESISMVREALKNKVDRIMLDNMSPKEMRIAVQLIGKKSETEASGNISEKTIKTVAKTGVKFISIGTNLTNSVKCIDFSMKVK